MKNDKVKESLYNTWHESLGKVETGFKTLQDPWYQTVMKLLPDLNNKKILEIGAGRGDFSIWLAQQYPQAHITGTDFSGKAVEIAIEKSKDAGLENLSFEVQNAEALTYHDESFDFIISCETMEHVFKPDIMAKEMFRVLKMNGQFILTTENYFNGIILMWIKTWLTKKPFDSGCGIQPHENFFLFFKVANFFKRAGFKLTHTESNHFQFLMLPAVDPARLCVKKFKSGFLNKFFKPFGRHYTYCGIKKPA